MVNKLSVHATKPLRTCGKTYAHYSSFKPFLRNDFNGRCGYCDDEDFHAGGTRGFQIDHFKPKSKFEELKHDYSNLVYSCPFCNRAKWDKWENNKGFIDPCNKDYDEHLFRNKLGKIRYETPQGQYIFEELNLGLERHEILWLIRKIDIQKQLLRERIRTLKKGHDDRVEALEQFLKIQDLVDQYTQLFRDSI